jgi:hypothetical protein
MRFVPYEQLGTEPNIIVDGSASPSTVLALSHWPKSGTPAELKRDTSAEIAFAYLDSPQFHVSANAVSNNHFDEDGLVGIFALIEPDTAAKYRELLIDVATAGDFGKYRRRDAARIDFVLSAYADPDTSPLAKNIFEAPYAEMAAQLYANLLPQLPRLLTDVADFRPFWQDDDDRLTLSEQLIEKGEITIQAVPDLDLAIVEVPESLARRTVHRFTQRRLAECHPFAIHNRTNCSRVLTIQGERVEFQYRYESWVQFMSRRPPSRVDLKQLAVELNDKETSGGRWVFEGVDRITPRLYLEGTSKTSIAPATIQTLLERHLSVGQAAWMPYD